VRQLPPCAREIRIAALRPHGVGCYGKRGGVPVPSTTDSLKDGLGRYREIKLTVIGRKSGHKITLRVWFALAGDNLYLLPVQGSDTQWYRNVLENPGIEIEAHGKKGKFRALPITDSKGVQSIIEKFREKYSAGKVKKYYSKFDVGVQVKVP
jgi:hypothetical protein